MAYLGKEYKLQKQENAEVFLKASSGLPEEQVAMMLQLKPTTKLVKNGDTYTYISSTPQGVKETSFKSGVEFDSTLPNNEQSKTKYIVDGNTVTQTMTSTEQGTAKVVREYNGDEMVLTMTSSKIDGVAKVWYKAV